MFALHSRRLRRKLSAPSASMRRHTRERMLVERTRLDGEQIARDWNELKLRQKLESQAQARLDLEAYEPWGRAGGGAPNPQGIRFTDIRAKGIYPEDELRGVQLESNRFWGSSPLRRRKLRQTPLRIREDPQCYYAENLRKSVDNDIRYRQTPVQQRCYKEILDEMVKTKQKALHEEMRRNLEFEQKMHQMEAPWGKPGPGGATWRDPRNVGLNFSKSMGWTDQEVFDKINADRRLQQRSSLALPQVKRDDDFYDYMAGKENINYPALPDKLPDIGHSNSPIGPGGEIGNSYRDQLKDRRKEIKPVTFAKGAGKRSPVKSKFNRRSYRGEEVQLTYPEDLYEKLSRPDEYLNRDDKKQTPEEAILNVTGGIELVPLLARRRRVGARTLPSSDVTRPPEQSCQWREMIDAEYLDILKHQMKAKCQQKERNDTSKTARVMESRQNSAESVRRHHETWASLWGRPGHGAPQQRGRYARSNLAQLLYVSPLPHHKNDPLI